MAELELKSVLLKPFYITIFLRKFKLDSILTINYRLFFR